MEVYMSTVFTNSRVVLTDLVSTFKISKNKLTSVNRPNKVFLIYWLVDSILAIEFMPPVNTVGMWALAHFSFIWNNLLK